MATGKPEGGAPGKPSRRRAGRLQAPRAGPPARRFRLSLCPQAGRADSPNSPYRGERRAGRPRSAGRARSRELGGPGPGRLCVRGRRAAAGGGGGSGEAVPGAPLSPLAARGLRGWLPQRRQPARL